MAAEGAKVDLATKDYLGITPPISTAQPTPADQRLDAQLASCLRGLAIYEDETSAARRVEVLGTLRRFVREWSLGLAEERGVVIEAEAEAGAEAEAAAEAAAETETGAAAEERGGRGACRGSCCWSKYFCNTRTKLTST